MTLLTTREAASQLGISQVRVRQLIKAGRLPAQLMGKFYLINKKDLDLLNGRQVGRPRKGD